MSRHSSEVNNTIERIKSEVETLKKQHLEALTAATYLGITSDEARSQEERRPKITHLMRDLTRLVEQISELHE